MQLMEYDIVLTENRSTESMAQYQQSGSANKALKNMPSFFGAEESP